MHRVLAAAAALAIACVAFACTVHQSPDQTFSGPSGLALGFRLNATPDSITQDGASQSSVTITAWDAGGRPLVGQAFRLEMHVNGTIQDFGTLSARTLVTDGTGKAIAIYTAPPAPPAFSAIGTCGNVFSGSAAGNCVTIAAIPIQTNSTTLQLETVDIRLVPPGVILPPGKTPKASFIVTPGSGASIGASVVFDGSASCANTDSTGACKTGGTIVSYAWDFGDGSTASGVRATHAFTAGGTFVVTLTVTNDSGGAASVSQAITINLPAAPTADFVFSPQNPVVGQSIFFDASISKSATGHNIVQFNWDFGDGASGSGITISHPYTAAGVYAVVLNVLDDAGQKASKATNVTVGSGNPTASFTATNASGSPPGHTVIFDGSGSSAAGGATIVSWSWNFGDSTSGSGTVVTHPYAGLGTFIVTLTVTDSGGKTGVKSMAVTVP